MHSDSSVAVSPDVNPQAVVHIALGSDLKGAIERRAADERRSVESLILNILNDWAFGLVCNLPPITEDELAKFRASKTKGRTQLKAKVRNRVFERDCGKCRHCGGRLLYEDAWHIDHLIPVSRGGTNDESNLALSCARCNLEKAAS